jgi:hypothetical protein
VFVVPQENIPKFFGVGYPVARYEPQAGNGDVRIFRQVTVNWVSLLHRLQLLFAFCSQSTTGMPKFASGNPRRVFYQAQTRNQVLQTLVIFLGEFYALAQTVYLRFVQLHSALKSA